MAAVSVFQGTHAKVYGHSEISFSLNSSQVKKNKFYCKFRSEFKPRQHDLSFRPLMMPMAAATSVVDAPEQSNNPSVKAFFPSLWADMSFSFDNQVLEKFAETIEPLKEEIRSMVMAKDSKPIDKMILIDTLERLGIAYHFEKEIEDQIEQIFKFHAKDLEDGNYDLFTTALYFRLFRQHGYGVSSSVFEKFKDEDNKFKKTLTSDINGLLSLFEASYLGYHGEDILEEAMVFITHYLNQAELQVDSYLQEKVTRALKQPVYRAIEKLEARYYISMYEKKVSKNDLLLRLAKFDFNYLQNLYKKEINDLFRPQSKNGDRPNIFEFFSPITKSRLAAATNSIANIETDDQKSVIQLTGDLRPELIPKHVALIMDGHGRWAKDRGVPIEHAHYEGVQKLKQLIMNCSKFGIKVLTVYVFSTENWNRPKEEVDFLMAHYEGLIQSFIKEPTMGQDLRFSVIGDKSRLPQSVQSTISSVENSTKTNTGMHFLMALSYGGRYDIIEATKKIASNVENGILRANDVNESVFEQQLLTSVAEFPNPDLLIRTSGELRVSNFMLWQLAYTEFYFPNKLFPDFEEADLIEALNTFRGRHRNFGGRNK